MSVIVEKLIEISHTREAHVARWLWREAEKYLGMVALHWRGEELQDVCWRGGERHLLVSGGEALAGSVVVVSELESWRWQKEGRPWLLVV